MNEIINRNSIRTTEHKLIKEEFGFLYYENGTYISKVDQEKYAKNPDKYIIDVDKKTGRATLALMPKF